MSASRKVILKMAIRLEEDIVAARQRARQMAAVFGLDGQDQIRFATAVSELVRNVYQYASKGLVEFLFDEKSDPQCLLVRVTDSGPGIADLNAVLSGEYVSETGMGIGLLGAKKLMDEFHIESSQGKGTSITIGKHIVRKGAKIGPSDLRKIVEKLASERPTNSFEEIQVQNRELLGTLSELEIRQRELRDVNEELAETNRGVVALYAEIDEKAQSLQNANEVKTKFLSHMTHEFRTPLTSILSLTRILLERMDGELTDEQERQVTLIRRSSESLLDLVNDLLDLAKVEAGKITVKTGDFAVSDIFSTLRGVFRPLMPADSRVDLVFDSSLADIKLFGDEAKIAQILRNLISNALKFTESGEVRVSAEAGRGETVVFKVKDTGIGISPEHAELIFQDYTQVDSSLQRRLKGTGLGLPLSRRLARLLGGDLWVESEIGKGSTFFARVPIRFSGDRDATLIQRAADESESDQTTSGDSQGRFRILIVDDDEPSRYVMKCLLRSEFDAEFIEAADGRIGLEKFHRLRPDAVILDLSMPKLNGIEFLEAIASADASIPIIINTAKTLSSEERAKLLKRASAILSKHRPDPEAAVRELRKALTAAGFDYRAEPLSREKSHLPSHPNSNGGEAHV